MGNWRKLGEGFVQTQRSRGEGRSQSIMFPSYLETFGLTFSIIVTQWWRRWLKSQTSQIHFQGLYFFTWDRHKTALKRACPVTVKHIFVLPGWGCSLSCSSDCVSLIITFYATLATYFISGSQLASRADTFFHKIGIFSGVYWQWQ